MRVVDGGALARYRDAVSRQVKQQGHTNGDTHVHTPYSQRGTHPAASPARQSMGESKMHSPAYFSSTPQPFLTDSMWGAPSTSSKSAANPWQSRGTAPGQGPNKLSKLLESIRQFEAHLDREEHRFLCPPFPLQLPPTTTATLSLYTMGYVKVIKSSPYFSRYQVKYRRRREGKRRRRRHGGARGIIIKTLKRKCVNAT